MAKSVNYSPELTASIIEQYEAGVDVATIAADIDKSVRSVRSKLVREGVYVAAPKATARKSNEPTKKECSSNWNHSHRFRSMVSWEPQRRLSMTSSVTSNRNRSNPIARNLRAHRPQVVRSKAIQPKRKSKMAVKIIRSKKSFATLSNQRSFAGLHKRDNASQADAFAHSTKNSGKTEKSE